MTYSDDEEFFDVDDDDFHDATEGDAHLTTPSPETPAADVLQLMLGSTVTPCPLIPLVASGRADHDASTSYAPAMAGLSAAMQYPGHA